jgi:hypothetical protein
LPRLTAGFFIAATPGFPGLRRYQIAKIVKALLDFPFFLGIFKLIIVGFFLNKEIRAADSLQSWPFFAFVYLPGFKFSVTGNYILTFGAGYNRHKISGGIRNKKVPKDGTEVGCIITEGS